MRHPAVSVIAAKDDDADDDDKPSPADADMCVSNEITTHET